MKISRFLSMILWFLLLKWELSSVWLLGFCLFEFWYVNKTHSTHLLGVVLLLKLFFFSFMSLLMCVFSLGKPLLCWDSNEAVAWYTWATVSVKEWRRNRKAFSFCHWLLHEVWMKAKSLVLLFLLYNASSAQGLHIISQL